MSSLYKQIIIDHYKNPRNYGSLEGDDVLKFEATNASCGDEITLRVKISDGVVEDLAFEGEGCAISLASSSMLFEKIKGLDLAELKELDMEKHLELLGMKPESGRIKCGLLPFHAIKKISSYNSSLSKINEEQ